MSTDAFQYVTFASFSPVAEPGDHSAADDWRLPEGEPVELIQGRLLMSPAPKPDHQLLLSRVLESAEATG